MDSTTPATKSHSSLHNFTLPHNLKWNKDGHHAGVDQHHQRQRSIKSPSNASSSSPVLQSSPRESSHLSPPIRQGAKRSRIADAPTPPPPPPPHFRRHDSASDSADQQRIHSKLHSNIIGASSSNPEKISQKLETKSKGKEVESPSSIKKSKILIKIPCSSRTADEEIPIPPPPTVENKPEGDADEETKMWNLRPRKPMRRPTGADGSGPVATNGFKKNKAQPKSGENSQKKRKKKKEKKKKVSIIVSLSKEEIEEDIFAMVGSKPARRPKKRPKIVQRRVDNCFPGLWLVSVSADSYKVSENPATTTTTTV